MIKVQERQMLAVVVVAIVLAGVSSFPAKAQSGVRDDAPAYVILDATDDTFPVGSAQKAEMKLQAEVTEYMAKGWRPIGGVSVSNNNGILVSQAMVKGRF